MQYVGSRYVPKFMGAYDATQAYEALCVVDNGLGTSYISKKPTPAGTVLTDTTYWAVYGASSGAIINLQNQIDDMKDGSINGSLQNQINILSTANYIPLSAFTGVDDTAKLQTAVDNVSFIYIDDDISIATIDITKPVTIYLGGHKITSITNENNTFNIRSSGVTIFGGEIETTVDDVNNVQSFGSCIYINDRVYTSGQIKYIDIHDLKVSTNGVCAITSLGETCYSRFYNLEIDGSRSTYVYPEGINFEWYGTAHVSTFHPHDILCDNIYVHDLEVGVRTAAAFNMIFSNIYVINAAYGVAITSGDFGGEAAQNRYKKSINRNHIIDNVTAYNSNLAVGLNGITTYPYGDIQANIRNVTAFDKPTVGAIVNISNAFNTVIENCRGDNLHNGIIITAHDSTVKDCFIANIQNIGIQVQGDNNHIDNNRIYNSNLAENVGIQGSSILASSGERVRITNNIVGGGDDEHQYFSIRNADDNSMITQNIIYALAINDSSTGSIVDNNITI